MPCFSGQSSVSHLVTLSLLEQGLAFQAAYPLLGQQRRQLVTQCATAATHVIVGHCAGRSCLHLQEPSVQRVRTKAWLQDLAAEGLLISSNMLHHHRIANMRQALEAAGGSETHDE